ncbi:hypothetical protein [Psychroflexus planctonicus]|uniref:Uncharacterized protein n=1 Tax=Psychroflexus planctonicus TaxID=1526575 RepID=A0ABQ1SG41_9FLAO|nr:hypothetical protein [Psychroflexus planctonicus]GGE38268.1 hypothetical protein GCM10010832_18150 [Psychroflexus planctonicus]
MKKASYVLILIIFSSCGIGNLYIIDNASEQKQKITINYVVNKGDLKEYYAMPDSLYITTNKSYSEKSFNWYKDAESKIPYQKIDEFTYQVELAKNQKIFIPYRYKFKNSIDKIQIHPNQEIFLRDTLQQDSLVNYYTKNTKPTTQVNYNYKLIGDGQYLIKINE